MMKRSLPIGGLLLLLHVTVVAASQSDQVQQLESKRVTEHDHDNKNDVQRLRSGGWPKRNWLKKFGSASGTPTMAPSYDNDSNRKCLESNHELRLAAQAYISEGAPEFVMEIYGEI